jgi:hypothetical protein
MNFTLIFMLFKINAYFCFMSQLDTLKKHLRPGHVYRRAELAQWSTAVDRHLAMLIDEGSLQKVSPGVYYYPKQSVFGKIPPDESRLIQSFLKDDEFLVNSPNAYNALGVGTTQLYNKTTVYNHKRHGEFKLGNRNYEFQVKRRFPATLSKEFLLVDLVNNLAHLAENPAAILKNVGAKVPVMDRKKLSVAVKRYGNIKTKKILLPMLNDQ